MLKVPCIGWYCRGEPRNRDGAAKIPIPRVVTSIIAAAIVAVAAPVSANEIYSVSGDDSFTIGSQVASHVVYSGTEQLQVIKTGPSTRFSAEARYTRTDETGNADARAHFVQEMAPGGTFADRVDQDPDSLTILNQPFAVQLDKTTLHDLATLNGSVPFDASSPIAGGTLHGTLRHGVNGTIDGAPAVAVRFQADGNMQGGLPDHPEIVIDGLMHMDGTAYYAAKTALLVALDAKLTITGTLRDQKTVTPVRIVYQRTIRANDALPWTEAGANQ